MITISDNEDENDLSIVFENVDVEYKKDACRTGRRAYTCNLREDGARCISTNADNVTHREALLRHQREPHRCGSETQDSFYDAYGSLSDLEEERAASSPCQYSRPCSRPGSCSRIRSIKSTTDAINKIRNSVDSGLETCEEEEDVLDEYVPQRGAMVFVKVEDSPCWRPGRVEEWIIELFQPVKCKVTIDLDTVVLVTADLLAYWNPPNRTLPVRCPVIACAGDPCQDNKFYAGLVFGSPYADNKHYYFIYFGNEGVQRVHYTRVRAVCDGCNNNADIRNRSLVWSRLEESLRLFEATTEREDGVVTEIKDLEDVSENSNDAAWQLENDGIASLTQAEEEEGYVEQEEKQEEEVQEVKQQEDEQEKDKKDEKEEEKDVNNKDSEISGVNTERDDQESNFLSKEAESVDEDAANPVECFSLETRKLPQPGDRVFVKVSGSLSWKRGQVDEIVKKSDTSMIKYMINVYQADTVVVTGNCLAYRKSLPRKTRLPVGTRVIANPQRDHWNEKNDYYAGLILENSGRGNHGRHLVFLERGDARYVKLKRIRLVCENSKNVWEDMDTECQDFVRSFILGEHHNNVEVKAGDEVKVKLNGKKWKAKVVEVGRSLIKVKLRNDRMEWIFRSASLLFPDERTFETKSNEKGSSTLVIRIKPPSGSTGGTTTTTDEVTNDTCLQMTCATANKGASEDSNITASKCAAEDRITARNDASSKDDITAGVQTLSRNNTFVDNSDTSTQNNTVEYASNNIDSIAKSTNSASNPTRVDFRTHATISTSASNTVNNHGTDDSAVSWNVNSDGITSVRANKNKVQSKHAAVKSFSINDIIAADDTATTSARASNTTTSKSSSKDALPRDSRENSTSKERSGRGQSDQTAACYLSPNGARSSAIQRCEHVRNSTDRACTRTNKCTGNIPRNDTSEIPFSTATSTNSARLQGTVPTISAPIPRSIPTSASPRGAFLPYSAAVSNDNIPVYPSNTRYSTVTNDPMPIPYNNPPAVPFYSTPFSMSSNNNRIFPWAINRPSINFPASLGSSSSQPTYIPDSIDSNYRDIGVTLPSNIYEQSEIIPPYDLYNTADYGIPAASIHTTDPIASTYHDIGIPGIRQSSAAHNILAEASNSSDRFGTNYHNFRFRGLSNISEHTTGRVPAFNHTSASREIFAATSGTTDRVATNYRDISIAHSSNISEHTVEQLPAFQLTATTHDVLAPSRNTTDPTDTSYRDIGSARPSNTSGLTTEEISVPAIEQTASMSDVLAAAERNDNGCLSCTSGFTFKKIPLYKRASNAHDTIAATRNTTDPIATKYCDNGAECPHHSKSSEHTRDGLPASKPISGRHIIPAAISVISTDRIATNYRDIGNHRHRNSPRSTAQMISSSKSTTSACDAANSTTNPRVAAVASKCCDIGSSRPRPDNSIPEKISSIEHTCAANGIPRVISNTGTTDTIATKYRDVNVFRPSNSSEDATEKIAASNETYSGRCATASKDIAGATKHLDVGILRLCHIGATGHSSAACDTHSVTSNTIGSNVTGEYRDIAISRNSNTFEGANKMSSFKQTASARNISAAPSDYPLPVATKYRDTAIEISRHSKALEQTTQQISVTALKVTPAREVNSTATSMVTDRAISKSKDTDITRHSNTSDLRTEKSTTLKGTCPATSVVTDRFSARYRDTDIPQYSNTLKYTTDKLASKETVAARHTAAANSNATGPLATKYREIGSSHLNASEQITEKVLSLKHAQDNVAVTSSTINVTPYYVDLTFSDPSMTSTKKSLSASIKDSIDTDADTTRPREKDPTKLPKSTDIEIAPRKDLKIKVTTYDKTQATNVSVTGTTSTTFNRKSAKASVSYGLSTPVPVSKSASTHDKSKGRKAESGYNFKIHSLAETRSLDHQCGRRCVKAPFKKRMLYSVNPLSVSVSCGWRREILSGVEPGVRYTAPCGVTLFNMKDIQRYLETVFSKMTVDLFDFDPAVSLARYVYNKDYIRIGDLSNGAEEVKITVFNDVDRTLPEPFRYSTTCVRPSESKVLRVVSRLRSGCECKDDCSDRKKCPCRRARHSEESYQYRRLMKSSDSEISECNERCKCSESCYNSVVQNPLQLSLQVFRTVEKGWGVRCLYDIPKGTFICAYVGEILTTAEAVEEAKKHGKEYFVVLQQPKEPEKRWQDVDIFSESTNGKEEAKLSHRRESSISRNNLKRKNEVEEEYGKRKKWKKEVESKWKKNRDTRDVASRENSNTKLERPSQERTGSGTQPTLTNRYSIKSKSENYVLNARYQGNVARFFNYSCKPNMFSQSVSCEPRLPTLAFFAKERIPAGVELTWDYGSVPL